MRACVLDIGGTSVKAMVVDPGSGWGALEPMVDLGDPSGHWSGDFEAWVADRLASHEALAGAEVRAVSCFGVVDVARGVVVRGAWSKWSDHPLGPRLAQRFGTKQPVVVSDIVAHTCALLADPTRHPLLVLALGRGVGGARTDVDGRIVTETTHLFQDVRIAGEPATPAMQRQVWWACGRNGLAELQHRFGDDGGAERFGERLAALIAALIPRTAPRTVVLSGGIPEHWGHLFLPCLRRELEKLAPQPAGSPAVSLSPYGRATALWGLTTILRAAADPRAAAAWLAKISSPG